MHTAAEDLNQQQTALALRSAQRRLANAIDEITQLTSGSLRNDRDEKSTTVAATVLRVKALELEALVNQFLLAANESTTRQALYVDPASSSAPANSYVAHR